jgi:hypothetical protein
MKRWDHHFVDGRRWQHTTVCHNRMSVRKSNGYADEIDCLAVLEGYGIHNILNDILTTLGKNEIRKDRRSLAWSDSGCDVTRFLFNDDYNQSES